MRILWQAQTKHVAWWWTLLTIAGSINIALWFLLYNGIRPSFGGTLPADVNLMLILCAAYVFGCAFRSFLPRADVQRFCLFDTWLSSVVIGRSVATVAEISFSAQWALMLYRLGETSGVGIASDVALAIVPMIVVAQCCSWYGVVTTNYLANGIENSIWAVAFGLVGVALAALLPHFSGIVHLGLWAALLGIACFLKFLLTVDLPMYFNRWRYNSAEGGRSLGLIDGFRDATTRWVVTHDFMHWKEEIPWMSLYFTAAVWSSLALCFTYSLGDHFPHYRTAPAVVQQVQIPVAHE